MYWSSDNLLAYSKYYIYINDWETQAYSKQTLSKAFQLRIAIWDR